MSTAEIEKRLSAVEQEVARLKAEHQPAAKPHPIRALDAIHGTFDNDEAMRLGRKWRASQRPNFKR